MLDKPGTGLRPNLCTFVTVGEKHTMEARGHIGNSSTGHERVVELRSVLLVDDSREDNFIHTRQLKRHFTDCSVDTALDGQQGIETLRARQVEGRPPYDLICLDVNMPVLDGWGFLQAYDGLPASARAKFLGLMVSTALPSTARDIAERSEYVDFFISKPFDFDSLDAEIRKLS